VAEGDAALETLEALLRDPSADPRALAQAAMRVANELRALRDDGDRLAAALERVSAVFRRSDGGD
jgi:hypothetical protein